ncbi:MAG: FAD/NAD(P)-binding oxidoreductase [Elusimicrobia bacterium CG_4_10_14_0_2_um_filter_56_8]|nr:MAG: FAD/NAD(P)-binding oxidoreductase [Elusimicrobia bacterium CG_4_10_14_0_2_um_filter_56_8]
MNADVIIVGAGITGASIARELSRYKLKILLLEKEAEPAFGVSKSNSGIVHAGTQNPPSSLKGWLCVEGNRLIREEIAGDLGLDFSECGQLIVIFDPADLPELEKIKKEGEELGVKGLEIVDRGWLEANEPNLGPDIKAALLVPSAGILSPYRFVYAMVENAVKNGAGLRTSRKVSAIRKPAGGGFEVVAGGEVFRAKFLVNAAGLYADEISAMAGAPTFTITPRKGEEYLLDKKREHIVNRLVFPLPAKNSKGILIIKTSDGNPMIGPTAHEVRGKEDLSTSDEGLAEVLAGARRLVPSISKSDIISYFAGLRPVAGKDFIIRHEDTVPGLVNAAGIQSPGLTAAPAIAVMVAGILKKQGLNLERKEEFHRLRPRPVHLFQVSDEETRRLIVKNPAYGDIVCRCELVSAKEIREALKSGAVTLDGVKFRTRAQSGRCHGGFCTTRIMKIIQEELGLPVTAVSKRGPGSELIKDERKWPSDEHSS